MDAREMALRALIDVEANGAYSGVAIERQLRAAGDVAPAAVAGGAGSAAPPTAAPKPPAGGRPGAEAAFARELVLGVLKWQASLDDEIFSRSSVRRSRVALPILCILRLGAYQITHLSRVPAPAACDEGVKLAKKYGNAGSARFVNAVLRAIARDAQKKPAAGIGAGSDAGIGAGSFAALARDHSFPPWLAERWARRHGEAFAARLMESLNARPEFTIRVNRLRASSKGVAAALSEEGYSVLPGRYVADALRMPDPRGFSRSRAFADGLFSVQDEASMLCALALGARPGDRVLDMCAAPGGKSAYVAELTSDRSYITACDIYPRKIARMEQGFARLRLTSITAVFADARAAPAPATAPDTAQATDLAIAPATAPVTAPASIPATAAPAELMDCVLLDAPCSGFGILRRKPEIKWNRKESDIAALARAQAAMLDNAARHLRPGGALVYGVCTTEPEEGEEQAAAFLARHPGFRGDSLRPFLPKAVFAAAEACAATETCTTAGPRAAGEPFAAGESSAAGEPCAAAEACAAGSAGRSPPSAAHGHEIRLFPNTHGTDGFYIARFVRSSGLSG